MLLFTIFLAVCLLVFALSLCIASGSATKEITIAGKSYKRLRVVRIAAVVFGFALAFFVRLPFETPESALVMNLRVCLECAMCFWVLYMLVREVKAMLE